MHCKIFFTHLCLEALIQLAADPGNFLLDEGTAALDKAR